jgi:hypothetical protein
MHASHHAPTSTVEEDRPLAAHRLADQHLLPGCLRSGPQHGRVELDELDVGDREPGAQGDRHTVAGHRRWVRRRGEHLAPAAAGQHDRPRPHHTDRGDCAGRVEQRHRQAGGLAPADGGSADDEVERERPLEHRRPGRDGSLVERALDLGAAAVTTGVDDPVMAVAALAGERRNHPAGSGRVERRAQAHQITDRPRGRADESSDDGLVTQPGTGRQRVGHVVLDRVGRVEHSRQAALGPGRRTGVERALRDDQDAPVGTRGECRRQPGRTRPDDNHVGLALPRGRRRGQPARKYEIAHSAVGDGLPIAIIRSTDARARAATSAATTTSSVPVSSACSSRAGVIIFM